MPLPQCSGAPPPDFLLIVLCPSHSVLGLLPLVSMDCVDPWRLTVTSDLHWFHFSSPLMVLLLYHTVASLRRNQLIDCGRGLERAGSEVGGSCDIVTTTSNLSDDVIGDITAEKRRDMWRRAHRSRDVRILTLVIIIIIIINIFQSLV
ncbi:hypothetical protein KUCAC02_036264 [Chaenocephalus aceratus]|nr:hypothetical protein KUCAC02_036264 [Chaenocephalus aceratus]